MLRKLISMYIVYVVYFLGVGMTSSGIVLMPFNPVRYGIILAAGLLLFGAGSFINEFIIDKKSVSLPTVVKLILVSLTLAIGIGMISGGISHFKESPVYATYLIPLGILVSAISYMVKNNYHLARKNLRTFLAGVFLTSLLLHGALSVAADSYLNSGAAQSGGDVFMDMH